MQNQSEKLLIEDAIYSLERSNEALESFAVFQAMEFRDKLSDPMQTQKAMQWRNVFDSIIIISDDATKYIKELKENLFNKNDLQKFSYNKDAVLKFKNEGRDTVLFKMNNNYQKKILGLNEEMAEAFKKEAVSVFKDFIDLRNINNYSKIHFSKMLDNQFYLKLVELENRIHNIKNKFMEFCNHQCTVIRCFNFVKFAAIVGQNSNVFRKGDKVSITAGIGEFSTNAMPDISMANKKVEVNPDGVAIYEFAAPSKKGKYSVPVNIEYTKPDGTKDKKQYHIEYEVVE